MPDEITGLNSADREILRRVIRAELGRLNARPKTTRNPPDTRPWYYAKLTSDMDKGTYTDPKTFTFTIYYPDESDSDDPPQLIASTDTDEIDLEGVNRWNVEGTDNQQIRVEFMNGEWSPIVDCPTT